MVDLFVERARAVGAECFDAEGRPEALEAVLRALAEEGVADEAGRWAVWAAGGVLRAEERSLIQLRAPGVRFDVTPETASQALAGVTVEDYGVAETGTLLSESGRAERRLASTLPPLHIAILPVPRILASMAEALSRFQLQGGSFITAITGPSRTADIERVLTIGVHGPRRLLIVLAREWEDGGGAP
jgi:L-lactate dehydrogenase complex protein LldG